MNNSEDHDRMEHYAPQDLADLFGLPDASIPHERDLFTDEEIFAAYRAAYPEETARERANGLIRALNARTPLGIAGGTLNLLAAVSEDCARRVRRYQNGWPYDDRKRNA